MALFSLIQVGATAQAATLTATTSKEGKEVIHLAGEIAPGDSARLNALVKAANDAGRAVSGIRLSSPGGNLAEAVKLAETVKYGRIASVVPNGERCASACFIVFAAGTEKFASHSAWVGVHGASDQNGRETVHSEAATVSMARVVKELGVPPGIIGKMVVTRPDQMVWLSPDDLRSMGATMTGKPVQVPVPGNEVPVAQGGAPAQLPPSTATQASTKTPTWKDIVEGAMAISSRQNSGSPRFLRSCQPELKICSMAILFKTTDGTESMVRTAEDASGRLVTREVCDFNAFGDVRTCLDWERGTKRRDMKDRQGSWYKVEDE